MQLTNIQPKEIWWLVISNGTAVLGLGDIGAMAGKPVMEGKGLLFKILQVSMYSTLK
jgi:malic enzyme